jgi:hypothetical protein
VYDGGALPTDDPSQHDQPEDHPTRSANVTAPSGARADVHAYTKTANDRDGYITYHG